MIRNPTRPLGARAVSSLRSAGILATLVTLLSLASCGTGDGTAETANAADTLTRRQKDSIVSTMPIPGAGVVGRALQASDRARERALAHDTIR